MNKKKLVAGKRNKMYQLLMLFMCLCVTLKMQNLTEILGVKGQIPVDSSPDSDLENTLSEQDLAQILDPLDPDFEDLEEEKENEIVK